MTSHHPAGPLSRPVAILPDAVMRPRATVRMMRDEGAGPGVSRMVVSVAALSFAVGTVWEEIAFTRADPSMSFFATDGAPATALELLAMMTVAYLFIVALYPLTLFVWQRVFGYRDQPRAVRAATDAAFALTIVTSMAQAVLTWLILKLGNQSTAWGMLYAAMFAVTMGYCAVYYAEALSIPVLSAFAMNLALLLGLAFPALLAVFGYFIFSELLSGGLAG